MMDISYSYLSGKNDCLVIKQEVPFLSRCIDIVYINKNQEVISIELKVHDWRHAIEQATNHKLGADRSYICIPKRKISDTLSTALQSTGIGLLFFDKSNNEEPVYEVLEASHNKRTIPVFKEMLIENVNKI